MFWCARQNCKAHLPYVIFDRADPFDLAAHDVAGREEPWRLKEEGDTGRRAGEDDVAGIKCLRTARIRDKRLKVFNAEHLRRILAKYATYYNEVRTHVSLGKDTPCTRPIERVGDIVAYPILS